MQAGLRLEIIAHQGLRGLLAVGSFHVLKVVTHKVKAGDSLPQVKLNRVLNAALQDQGNNGIARFKISRPLALELFASLLPVP